MVDRGWSRKLVDQRVGRVRRAFMWAASEELVQVGVYQALTTVGGLAACLATEREVGVCCPVHDAFMIEADADQIEGETVRMQEAMLEASELVMPGFPLGTDANVVRHPDRYADPRGERMWATVTGLLTEHAAGP